MIFLPISRENGCQYCTAAHRFVADAQSKVPPEVTDAIRDHQPIPDAKLAALSQFTVTLVKTRGRPTRRDVEQLLMAGCSEQHILTVAVKTLSDYSNRLFHTPVDGVFASRAWNG